MSKNYRIIALVSSCLTFGLSSCIYTDSDSGAAVSFSLLTMLVSSYFIVRILDSILDFKE